MTRKDPNRGLPKCLCGVLASATVHADRCPWPELGRTHAQINSWHSAKKWIAVGRTLRSDFAVQRFFAELHRCIFEPEKRAKEKVPS